MPAPPVSPRRVALTLAASLVLAALAVLSLPSIGTAAATRSSTSAGAEVAGSQLSALPFPRLAALFPDPSKQPLSSIARNDWVLLSRSVADPGALAASLKQLNPSLIALIYASADFVPYSSDPDAESSANDQLRSIPARWLLTQVGADLTQDVSATDTIWHVDRVTATNGQTTYPLFQAGDSVVVDDEIAYVESVDSSDCTLTVRRGLVNPPISHSAGARVAALISCYPGTLLADLSTYCPRVTVDPTVGPEAWSDYRARAITQWLADPRLDGVYLDNDSPTISAYVTHSTDARTIDVDRSNTLVTDYEDFDAAWGAGVLEFETQLRSLLGLDRVIMGNCAMPNYGLLNGTDFEDFPDSTGTWFSQPWAQTVFGPSPLGSYLDWLSNAQQPDLTTILTHAFDTDSPVDYRKMRFGLCTALMNDGFFACETTAAAQGEQVYFDEYDDAGRDPGYLGQPEGPAQRVLAGLSSSSLVSAGFDAASDLTTFKLNEPAGYSARATIDTTDAAVGAGSLRVDVTQTGGNALALHVALTHPVSATAGTQYTLSFWAKADSARTICPWVQQSNPSVTWLNFHGVSLSTGWQHIVVSATATAGGSGGTLFFPVGQSVGSVWFDDVKLQRGTADVWRRDFTGGVALVNASPVSVTVPLGGVFRHINGTQVPSVNDGSLVDTVVVPSMDGVVLIRPDTSAQSIAAEAVAQLSAAWQQCSSRSGAARRYYAKLAGRSSGSRRVRARRARLAWAKALASIALGQKAIATWQAALSASDATSAAAGSKAAQTCLSCALKSVSRAWVLGHAVDSHATQARSWARTGRSRLLAAQAATSAFVSG